MDQSQLSYLARAAFKILLMPPGIFFILMTIGLIAMGRSANQQNRLAQFKFGKRLITLCLLAMYVCSTGLFANAMGQLVERGITPIALTANGEVDIQGAQAIIILAGGQRNNAQENPNGIAPSWRTLERLAYGARLAKQTGLEVLVTGGTLYSQTYSEASAMQQALISDFGLRARWVEDQSLTTAQNAQFSAVMLSNSGVKRVLLVTHASHMIRSVDAFKRAGLEVVAAPTAFTRETRAPLLALLPNAHSLGITFDALHELIGIQWYRLTGAGS